MQKIIDKMRGPLTCLVVFALMVMTPFQDPQIALASDYVDELQWSQMETELLEGNSLEWHLENSDVDEAVEAKRSVEEEAPAAEAPVVEDEIPAEKEENVVRQKKEIPLPQWRIKINHEQLDLLERCVMAEGGGESYECQVAIACVIINRVLSEDYPNTVDQVIKQTGQFSTWPSIIERVTPTNEVKQAVREALTTEFIPENVLFFRADRYHRWGNRYCRMDNTYFSTP
ncbi:MAG: cell wall hydrolase [Lachnospiraceae bacterium]|nr:cell wall hydrolase [Lachnospiraceae bacterium]